jgi:hypothetical protein
VEKELNFHENKGCWPHIHFLRHVRLLCRQQLVV